MKRQLENLPEMPENVELEIQTGLMAFADSSRAKMDEFMRHFNVLPRNFRDCLLAIKPKFTLKDSSDIVHYEISDDDSDTTSGVPGQLTPTPKRHAQPRLATPAKRQRTNGSTNGTPVHIKPEEPGDFGPPARPPNRPTLPEPFTEFSGIGRGFRTLRQVREEMQAKTKAGMPDRISEDVYVDLVREAVQPWNRPMEAFIRRTMKDLHTEIETALGLALENLKKRFIYKEAKKHVQKCLEEHRKDTERGLMRLYDDERGRLLTFNEEAFSKYKEDEHILLTRFRHNMRMEAAGFKTQPLGQWSELTDEKRAQEARRREAERVKLGPDQFERELEVVSYVRGYYRLAALRFADAVSQHILCRMIPSIRRQLPSYLEDKLGLKAPNARGTYERLMAEDESTANKRENLKSEQDKFVKALDSIELLETGEAWRGPEHEEGSTQPMSSAGVDVDVHMSET